MRLKVVLPVSSGDPPKFLRLMAPSDDSAVVATEWVAEEAQDAATASKADEGLQRDLSRTACLSMEDDGGGGLYLQLWCGQMQGYGAAALLNGFDRGGLILDVTATDSAYTESWGALPLERIALPSEHAGGMWHFNPTTSKLVLCPTLTTAGCVKSGGSDLLKVRAVTG